MAKLEISIEGRVFVADLLEDSAPKTCKKVLSLLPIESYVLHARWCGNAIFIPEVPRMRLEPENRTILCTAGDILWGPEDFFQGDFFHDPQYKGELFIAYDEAIFQGKWARCCRLPDVGPIPTNLFAKISENLEELKELGERVQKEGMKNITVKRKTS